MTKIWEGKPKGEGLRIGVVVGRFNSTVTDKLLAGALEALEGAAVSSGDIEVVRVPGAFEIPLAAKRLAEAREVDAVVCLGAIVKGGTPHWDYLSDAVTKAIADASLATNVPMSNGVLTTENVEHAIERAEKGPDNKGHGAAMAAVEMAELYRRLGAP